MIDKSEVNGGDLNFRVLHVLDHYLPNVDGYAIRSSEIIRSQKGLGFSPAAVTSALDPRELALVDGEYGGIRVFRSAPQVPWMQVLLRRKVPILREYLSVRLLQKKIESVLRAEAFDIVHAHSPALCGLSALRAARRFGIPVVYEVRAFWEDAAVDQGRATTGSPRYVATRWLETKVARGAAAVVGISNYILKDLAGRGIDPAKMFHVPNGVDCKRFVPRPPDPELNKRFNPGSQVLFGFIGSFFRFEGVAWMVKAFAELRKSRQNFQVLLVGDGEDMVAVKAAIQEAEAGDYIFALGRVPHEEIGKYYSIMDVLVYPRISIRLTELVTALKPLEALAQEKAVLSSGVAAMKELISDGTTGLLFGAGDVQNFCQKATSLIDDPGLRERLGKQGRVSMLKEKDWDSIGAIYKEVYASCIPNQPGSR